MNIKTRSFKTVFTCVGFFFIGAFASAQIPSAEVNTTILPLIPTSDAIVRVNFEWEMPGSCYRVQTVDYTIDESNDIRIDITQIEEAQGDCDTEINAKITQLVEGLSAGSCNLKIYVDETLADSLSFKVAKGSSDSINLCAEFPSLKERGKALLADRYDDFTGAQCEYFDPNSKSQKPNPIVQYGRVWVYGQGIALSQAARSGQSGKAHKLAQWLYNNRQWVDLEEGTRIHAGWHFSQNTDGDDFKDPRFITGANAWVAEGLAEYLASSVFQELSAADKSKYRQFYADVLDGLLYHQVMDTTHPNAGLFRAGWSKDVLKNLPEGFKYNEMIGILGYPDTREARALNPQTVQLMNVVTEHNIDMLSVLNFTIDHFSSLELPSTDLINLTELTNRRNHLRTAIFDKLFKMDEGRFITGRDASGVSSVHTAIDNASWLARAVNFAELNSVQREKLGQALLYTVDSFVKFMDYQGRWYYGAHYFQSDFEDLFITKGGAQTNAYHLEATTGLILGLNEYADAYPEDGFSSYFRYRAKQLWLAMQPFVEDNGFIYSSESIQDLFSPLESITSAVWYIDIYDYYDEHPEACDGPKVDHPHH